VRSELEFLQGLIGMSTGRWRRALTAGAGLVLAGAALTASAAPWRGFPAAQTATDRVIVKWRDSGVAAVQIATTEARTARLSAATGVALSPVRTIHDRVDVMRLESPMAGMALRHVLSRLKADPFVLYAEADERRYALAAPNDPRFSAGSDANGQWDGQWYLNDPNSTTPAAIGATTAWDTATGSGYVIAIIDTGVDLTHPDLGTYGAGGKLLPGYDFICNDSGSNCTSTTASNTYLVANDGTGWDADPTDPGDWISLADLQRSDNFFKGCGGGTNQDQPINSTWHGTRVAGIAAALTNNKDSNGNYVGIAGTAPDALLLPVRVIGKCSGYVSDIVAGMYWAAGLTNTDIVNNAVPTNLHPATVLNLSLGASSACTQTEQDAVNAILQDGHAIVAAAGNDGGPVGAPADCRGVISVAGLRHIGTKVGYSDVSSTASAITIAAPAGNCVNVNSGYPWALPCVYSIETTSNDGLTVPGHPTYTYALFAPGYAATANVLNEGSVGTSFAAPIVSGVVALMVQANPNLTSARLIARLQASATPFPTPASPATGGLCHVAALTQDSNSKYTDLQTSDCQCTSATCGAGMLNAAAAVSQALNPLASITTSVSSATVGQSVTLDGTGSTASNNLPIAAYQWSASSGVSIANAHSAVAKLVFPALRPITVTLTVTDSMGRQDTATATINSKLLSAGGGRGALDPTALAFLALGAATVFVRRRRRSLVMLRVGLPTVGRRTHG